jgi:NitT/TauT family transport system permease protein
MSEAVNTAVAAAASLEASAANGVDAAASADVALSAWLHAGASPLFWPAILLLALLAGYSIVRTAALEGRWAGMLTAAVFGLWVVFFWEVLVRCLDVSRVFLPAPSFVLASIVDHAPKLWGDFVQTVGKAVLIGWALGCGLGFAVAVAIDRMPFLQRGLLPVASLTSAIPLVAVAPIAVMWFGFEWESKAAVVVLMTFFPMLVSTLAGLKASGKLERELMYSYAASYTRTLVALRLPSALPHIFNALKVNATLALIGAIVAEFFGSPTSGLGFRISTEAARMNMPLVWGAIVVAAVTGSLAYALLVALERRAAFWHPSIRGVK